MNLPIPLYLFSFNKKLPVYEQKIKRFFQTLPSHDD